MKISYEDLYREYILNKLSIDTIAEKYNIAHTTVNLYLHKYKIQVRSRSQNLKNIVGQRFGRLIVIKKVINTTNYTDAKFLCKCDCGKETEVIGRSLRFNKTKSCGCLKFEKLFKGFGKLSSSYWNRVVKGAKKRNLELKITIKDAWELFLKQNQKCALTGIDIVIVSDYTHHHHLHTASLDRIDNDKGYTKDNIRWVHRDINIMRNNHTDEEFIDWCKLVANFNK